MELSGGNGSRLSGIRRLIDEPARGTRNMAVDEALMDSARHGVAILRFYAWQPGCLSLGRNQLARDRYDGGAARARGIDIVRRPTGGRAVYHDRELTYSVVAPAACWGSLRDSYLRINRALAAGLRRLGAPAELAPARRSLPVPPSLRACFRDPLPGEVTVGGRKLVGSAQWRDRGAFLQHGSILLENAQGIVEELRRGREAPVSVPAAALGEILPAVPSLARIVAALEEGFEEEFGLPLTASTLTSAERCRASELARRYQDPAWTWRR